MRQNKLTEGSTHTPAGVSDGQLHLQSTGVYIPSPADASDIAGRSPEKTTESLLNETRNRIVASPSFEQTVTDSPSVDVFLTGNETGENEEIMRSVRRTLSADPEGIHIIDDTCPSRTTPASQLQTMAELLHRHQMEQMEKNKRIEELGDISMRSSSQESARGRIDTAQAADLVSDRSITLQDQEEAQAGPSTADEFMTGGHPLTIVAASPKSGEEAKHPSATVLGKRKERSHSSSISGSAEILLAGHLAPDGSVDLPRDEADNLAHDEAGEGSIPLDNDGKRRRQGRKRKPPAEPIAKASKGRRISRVPATLPTQRFKCESRRRWKSLEPYVTMMKMLLKTTMGDGWQIMADVLAKVSPAEEQKDIRRIKQTWANEYTRLKTKAATGRLVTLQHLNSSWPWSLEEKKQLWRTGIDLCIDKANWDLVTAEVNNSAKASGEPEVTSEECRAEWDNVLRYEYTDEVPHDLEPAYGPSLVDPLATDKQAGSSRVSSHQASPAGPDNAGEQPSAILNLAQSETGPSSILDDRSTYQFALNDYVNADLSITRLGDIFVGGTTDVMPVNRPVQVQPARFGDVGVEDDASIIREAGPAAAMMDDQADNQSFAMRVQDESHGSRQADQQGDAEASFVKGIEMEDVSDDVAKLLDRS